MKIYSLVASSKAELRGRNGDEEWGQPDLRDLLALHAAAQTSMPVG
jgi:hypothetical protein